jgi:hypothetical protein
MMLTTPNEAPIFLKRKLNRCAHCSSKETTVVFTADGFLYFICRTHHLILVALKKEAMRGGVAL